MAIKIDLEKAYDRLHWEIVKETLEDIHFPQIFWILYGGAFLPLRCTSCGTEKLWRI